MAANVHRSHDHRALGRSHTTSHRHLPTHHVSRRDSQLLDSYRRGSAIQGINQLQLCTKPNEYVDVTTHAVPQNAASREHGPTRRRRPLSTSTNLHDKQMEPTNLNLCTCRPRPQDLTVDMEGMPPPLLPRLPRRKVQRAKSLPGRTHRRPPPAPPVNRETKPPIHKVASMNYPCTKPTVFSLQPDERFTTSHTSHTHSGRNERLNHSVKIQRQTKTAVTLHNINMLPVDTLPRKRTKDSHSTVIKAPGNLSACDQCKRGDLSDTWLCDGTCHLSEDTCIDITSCMCVAKRIMHCGCNTDENETIKNPCSCTPSANCCKRWTTLTFLSLCFPCLLCYLPLKCCKKATRARYDDVECRHNDCQCNH